uniref:Sma protein, putative n=1 Tax=Babesia bovis TaxID=5865 RepID=S6B0X1_BABBO|nr:Sma protein, putative [Babesia bovis]
MPPRRNVGLVARLKAIVFPAPKHNAMYNEDAIVLFKSQANNRPWTAKISPSGFRLKKPMPKIKEPEFDIFKVLSNASQHLDIGNVQEHSEYSYKLDSSDCIQLEDDMEVPTPTSVIEDISETLPWNHPLSDYRQCINLAVHLKAPVVKSKPEPQPKMETGFNRRVQKRKMKLSERKGGFMKRIIGKFKLQETPDAHAMPQFMVDMQSVIKEPRLTQNYADHPFPIPKEYLIHQSKQLSKWNWYYNMEARQFAWRRHLPIPHNHTFVGVPIHFSTSDINEIRHLMHYSKRCKKMLVPNVDRCVNVVYVKVYPLLGGVFSTWIFLGCHVP